MCNVQIISYLDSIKYERKYSDFTLRAYEKDILQFAAFCDEKGFSVISAVPGVVREWIVSLIEAGYNRRSVNRKISALRSFYKFLIKSGFVLKDPMVKSSLLKVPRTLPSFVPSKVMDLLLDSESLKNDDRDFSAKRDLLILETFYFTGVRLSELMYLRHSDIDCVGLTLKVLGKRNKQRIIPILKEFGIAIEEYLQLKSDLFPNLPHDYFFVLDNGKALYRTWVYRLVNKSLREVTSMSKKSPHVLRHTFATLLLNNGAELTAIKELLGHASLAATQVYTHNSFSKIKKVYNNAHPRA